MAKNIVFCADGTWNGPGEEDHGARSGTLTNVFKLFSALEGTDTPESLPFADEQERKAVDTSGQTVQHAKYLHGVGDSQNPLVKFLGGAFGAGLIARVVRGYTFVSRNYAEGDQIYLAGFSRGSYTARALAGLIAKQGLLDARKLDLQDKEIAYRLGSAVWYRHQRSLHSSFLADLQTFVDYLPGFLNRAPDPETLIQAPIRAVAVWDTVGALGIPAFAAHQKRLDLFRFVDTALHPKVAYGFHAVAVDEARADFTPTFWEADPRVTQALFPGAHADVGGGYATTNHESGLSDGALVWMTSKLAPLGLRFAPTEAPAPDPLAPAHQPWEHFPWTALPSGPRTFPPGYALHRSVLARLGKPVVPEPGQPAQPYAPGNLQTYLEGAQPLPGIPLEG